MSSTQLTPRDLELLAKAMRCVKGECDIQLDNEKFAEVGGFKNANSARVAWHGLKKKIFSIGTGGDDAASSGVNQTPSKGKKRKASAAAAVGDDTDPARKLSKTKKARNSSKGRRAEEYDEATITSNVSDNEDAEPFDASEDASSAKTSGDKLRGKKMKSDMVKEESYEEDS